MPGACSLRHLRLYIQALWVGGWVGGVSRFNETASFSAGWGSAELSLIQGELIQSGSE